jgi:DNA-binding MarR family transcriptional regulator
MSRERPFGEQYQPLEDFRYEIRRFLNFSERAARQAGLEPQQHQALLSIKAARIGAKVTVGYLAERLQVQHHSAVELSDRLEERKLIRRRRSGADRRKVLLSLTERGEELLRKLSDSHQLDLRTRGPRLLKALRGVIRRANVRDQDPNAVSNSPRKAPAR